MDLIEFGLQDPINHWYYKHKFWFIRNSKLWKKPEIHRLIDIGAGSALFSKELLRQGMVNHVVAVDTGYVKYYEVVNDLVYCQSHEYSGFSHVLLTDVLEHVKDDRDFLTQIVKNSDAGTAFIVTVPALMSLWSGHDVFLKHFRRYTKKQLLGLASNAGLRVHSVRYTFATVYLAALIQRKFLAKKDSNSQLTESGWFLNSLLQLLLIPDRWISFLPFGVSIYLEATKDG